MQRLKNVLWRDGADAAAPAPRLALDAAQDIAHFLAAAFVLSQMSSHSSKLKDIAARLRKDDAAREQEYLAIESGELFQSFAKPLRNSNDVLTTAAPTLALSGTKVQPLLLDIAFAFSQLQEQPIDEIVRSAGFIDATTSIVSHPARLSTAGGSGGFRRVEPLRVSSDFFSMTEADFLTQETETLTCDARWQRYGVLLLAKVVHGGRLVALKSLLEQDRGVCDRVSEVYRAHDTPAGVALVAALAQMSTPSFFGEPQVFFGDLPDTRRVSIMTPFSLYQEVQRAKRAMRTGFAAEREADVAAIQEEILAAQAQLDELPPSRQSRKRGAGAPATPELEEIERQRKDMTKLVTRLEQAAEQRANRRLWIPDSTLAIGGSVPRNVAMDLDTTLHSANVLARVPTSQHAYKTIGNRAFLTDSQSLLQMPKLPVYGGVPHYLRESAHGAVAAKKRAQLFSELVFQALEPLLELRDAWRRRADALIGAEALDASAVDAIEHQDSDWALFIKGDATLNSKQISSRLEGLARQVFNNAKQALHRACRGELTAAFDAELMKTAVGAIAAERT